METLDSSFMGGSHLALDVTVAAVLLFLVFMVMVAAGLFGAAEPDGPTR